ncbi:acetylcholinesterase-like [Anneissia japonica]|uniref:acetylcholinesterase-like n=1 Tax=Anneissia japonica TaxID=1529436 RepID=UPI001425AB75|nr:acetylcholinesterase-like [Anneissia japonica]XP_033096077.1 acetylcholinesterase-like [Anneissia japonica]XP_033096078.1 acetylcholinesterase-like [Anneissia japonica]XP_033096079.1 acetylcholinesterase-like [Anneissia japonica]
MCLNSWIFFAVTLSIGKSTRCQDIVVTITQGNILGKRLDVLDKSVDAFLGIPYAEPPKNERRFKHPEPRKPWPGTLNATMYGFGCMQLHDLVFPGFKGTEMWNPNVELDEDCLNLNVWVPYPRPINAAVMVWIYGGGFYSGVASLDVYDGKTLAAEENIIVVSMNYRLGALGFLAMGDEAPGNAGLLDQALALRWVQDNIARFGGNPDAVTLFSESAGSASVNFHLFSPVSRNLFKRAIMQSGSANAPWAYYTKEEGTRRGELLATKLNCTISTDGQTFSVNEMVQCMRSRKVENILDEMWVTAEFMKLPFVPVIDGTFIREAPELTMKTNSFQPCEIIIGSNLNEANFFLIYGVPGFNKDNSSILDELMFQKAIEYIWSTANEFSHDAIKFQYTDWLYPGSHSKRRDAIDQALGDACFICPTFQFAKSHANFKNIVYYYRFTQRDSNHPFPEWMGVLHGDEIAYFFGVPLHPENGFSEEDKKLSRQMMAYYANFARTGNPNNKHDSKLEVYSWPIYNAENLEYLVLNGSLVAGNPVIGRGPRADYCMFWGAYYPELQAKTGDVEKTEAKWKSDFQEWSNKYMASWKSEFNKYINNANQMCSNS